MAKIDVTLINAEDGEAWPAEVVVDKPIGWWVEDLLEPLGLPREVGGETVRYQFVIERSGATVSELETFESFDLHEADVLRLERVLSAVTVSSPPGSTGKTSGLMEKELWQDLVWIIVAIAAVLITQKLHETARVTFRYDDFIVWSTLIWGIGGGIGGLVTGVVLQPKRFSLQGSFALAWAVTWALAWFLFVRLAGSILGLVIIILAAGAVGFGLMRLGSKIFTHKTST